MKRRDFLSRSSAALIPAAALASASAPRAASGGIPVVRKGQPTLKGRIWKAVKWSMIQPRDLSVHDQFRMALDTGFDGITITAPGVYDLKEVLEAQDKTGIPIHNVNVANHWKIRLTDPDPAVRDAALLETIDALKFTHDVGGSSILQVIGKVTDPVNENHAQVWERSTEQLKKALPTAAQLGVHIACENVANDFCYNAGLWKSYIDQFHSCWLGAFFDIGNLDRFGGSANWIKALGHRIVKLDVKDHNHDTQKNCALFEGHVDWAAVQSALLAVNFSGWATAEVPGGDATRLKEVAANMDKALGLA